MKKNCAIVLSFCLMASSLFSSCYRMPSEEDYSVIPVTNNPDVTRESGSSMMPTVSY